MWMMSGEDWSTGCVECTELFLSLFFAMIRHIYLLICTQVRFLPSTEIGRQGHCIFQGLH